MRISKIRDLYGYWLEYFSEVVDVRGNGGFECTCPECLKERYVEYECDELLGLEKYEKD